MTSPGGPHEALGEHAGGVLVKRPRASVTPKHMALSAVAGLGLSSGPARLGARKSYGAAAVRHPASGVTRVVPKRKEAGACCSRSPRFTARRRSFHSSTTTRGMEGHPNGTQRDAATRVPHQTRRRRIHRDRAHLFDGQSGWVCPALSGGACRHKVGPHLGSCFNSESTGQPKTNLSLTHPHYPCQSSTPSPNPRAGQHVWASFPGDDFWRVARRRRRVRG